MLTCTNSQVLANKQTTKIISKFRKRMPLCQFLFEVVSIWYKNSERECHYASSYSKWFLSGTKIPKENATMPVLIRSGFYLVQKFRKRMPLCQFLFEVVSIWYKNSERECHYASSYSKWFLSGTKIPKENATMPVLIRSGFYLVQKFRKRMPLCQFLFEVVSIWYKNSERECHYASSYSKWFLSGTKIPKENATMPVLIRSGFYLVQKFRKRMPLCQFLFEVVSIWYKKNHN